MQQENAGTAPATENTSPGPFDDTTTTAPETAENANYSAKLAEQIENSFTYHPPKGDQAERYQTLRESAKYLAHQINLLVPNGREKSLAITHLEESIMFANAGIARNE
jgi:hypothetical protein